MGPSSKITNSGSSRRPSLRHLRALVPASVLLLLVAAACGGTDTLPVAQEPTTSSQTSSPVATNAPAPQGDPTVAPMNEAAEATRLPATGVAPSTEGTPSSEAPTSAPNKPGATEAVEPDPTSLPDPTRLPVPGAKEGFKEGNLAPDFKVTSTDGVEVSLDSLLSEEQPFLLVFFASW